MKINGFGQSYPINISSTLDKVNSQGAEAEVSGFESALQKAFDEGDKKKLREACSQFEAVMLKSLYKQMKATVPEGGFIEKSSARGIFEDMLDDRLMDQGSLRGIGIGEMMYRQLSAKMDKTYTVKPQETRQANQTEPSEKEEPPKDPANTLPDGADPVEE